MPDRMISDEEYAYLHAKKQTADFAETFWNDPKWNKELKRIIKGKYPQIPIQDYDLEMKLEAQLAAQKKERDDAEQAAKQKAEDERWQSQRRKVQAEYSYTDDGMGELDKWMADKGVGDYEVAASYRESKKPRVSEPTWDSTRWNHSKQAGYDEIAKDPENWGFKQIAEAAQREIDNRKSRF